MHGTTHDAILNTSQPSNTIHYQAVCATVKSSHLPSVQSITHPISRLPSNQPSTRFSAQPSSGFFFLSYFLNLFNRFLISAQLPAVFKPNGQLTTRLNNLQHNRLRVRVILLVVQAFRRLRSISDKKPSPSRPVGQLLGECVARV